MTESARPSPRREMLSALFRALEAKSIPYCVLRNYQNIYEDAGSDVDLAVEPEYFEQLKDCLNAAAAAAGYHFVLQARYVNFSYVYRHDSGSIIRIDVETEIRWRIFPVLTAQAVVGLRRRLGEFYIPHPRHESVVLFVAAIWRGQISNRYRVQLARLLPPGSNREEFRRTFLSVFGFIGDGLLAYQEIILHCNEDPRLWKVARRSLARNALRGGPNRKAWLRHLASDSRRLWERIKNPPGISMLYVSDVKPARNFADLFLLIRLLYPAQKSAVHSLLLDEDARRGGRLSWKMRLERCYTLFKGGLFLRYCHAPSDRAFRLAALCYSRYLYPARAFVCAEHSGFTAWLGHVETGFMAEPKSGAGYAYPDGPIAEFISDVLRHYGRGHSGKLGPATNAEAYDSTSLTKAAHRGAFVVIVGAEPNSEAGLARALCCHGVRQGRFSRIRFFRWRPGIIGGPQFPLPENWSGLAGPASTAPGKVVGSPLARNDRRSNGNVSVATRLFSTGRLIFRVIIQSIACHIRVRRLISRNSLVLSDGSYLRYYLDPASARYYGPGWLVDLLRPLVFRPDLVVILKSAPDRQSTGNEKVLKDDKPCHTAFQEKLRFPGSRFIEADQTLPMNEVAQIILNELGASISNL